MVTEAAAGAEREVAEAVVVGQEAAEAAVALGAAEASGGGWRRDRSKRRWWRLVEGGGSSAPVGAGGLPEMGCRRCRDRRRLHPRAPSSRPPTVSSFGLTEAQERTWDTFQRCASNGAMLDELRVDESFTFQATRQSDVRTIKDCMTRAGYRFSY